MKSRTHLSKSLFMKACQCPTKLYFAGKPNYYVSEKDESLKEVFADAGFQIGELAKSYYRGLEGFPDYVEIESLDWEESLSQTRRWVDDYSSLVLFESAFEFENLAVRADILKKQDSSVELIEVKSKVINSQDGVHFWKKKVRALTSEWEPYIKDIAFQYYVIKNQNPDWDIEPFLLLPDSSLRASVDNLNQMFPLGQKTELTRNETGDLVLTKISVLDAVLFVINEWTYNGMSFEKFVGKARDIYLKDEFSNFGVGVKCKKCEYRVRPSDLPEQSLNGFAKCWTSFTNLDSSDLDKPLLFDLWNFREGEQMLTEKKYFLEDILEADIKTEPSKTVSYGMSVVERQKLQLKKAKELDTTEYFDKVGYLEQSSQWKFPYNFIDFETTQLGLPFAKGHSCFELMAFQFSLHCVHPDRNIEHVAQYIHTQKNDYPSFSFLRSLKAELSKNEGTIFCYSMHENTVLLAIHDALMVSTEPDKKELTDWIKTITIKGGKKGWIGSRALVDQCELVKAFYYNPHTGGSNSIKKVLPAVVSSSTKIKSQLRSNTYGSSVRSLNFKDWSWLKTKSQLDPYLSLGANSIKDGAAALKAYFDFQFGQKSSSELAELVTQLLKYCELDTFAMTLLNERFNELLDK
jgi:hypothetical protein